MRSMTTNNIINRSMPLFGWELVHCCRPWMMTAILYKCTIDIKYIISSQTKLEFLEISFTQLTNHTYRSTPISVMTPSAHRSGFTRKFTICSQKAAPTSRVWMWLCRNFKVWQVTLLDHCMMETLVQLIHGNPISYVLQLKSSKVTVKPGRTLTVLPSNLISTPRLHRIV